MPSVSPGVSPNNGAASSHSLGSYHPFGAHDTREKPIGDRRHRQRYTDQRIGMRVCNARYSADPRVAARSSSQTLTSGRWTRAMSSPTCIRRTGGASGTRRGTVAIFAEVAIDEIRVTGPSAHWLNRFWWTVVPAAIGQKPGCCAYRARCWLPCGSIGAWG